LLELVILLDFVIASAIQFTTYYGQEDGRGH